MNEIDYIKQCSQLEQSRWLKSKKFGTLNKV